MKITTGLLQLLSISLLLGACRSESATFTVDDSGKTLVYSLDGKELFSYNYATVYPPAGVDTVYKRSGFIHPLKTLEGEILTNCSPAGLILRPRMMIPVKSTGGRDTDME